MKLVKTTCMILLLSVISFLALGCDSVADPEEEQGGSSGGGGSSPSINRYVVLLDADIHVMNTQTSLAVGGALVELDRGSDFSESEYTNSSGTASFNEDISIPINEGTIGLGLDIAVSSAGFNSVNIEDYIADVVFIESGDGWAHYALEFDYTVNIAPE